MPDQAFLEYVIDQLVEHPEQVEITRTVDEQGVLLRLKVAPSDMGRVVGRAGVTAKAIRTLLRTVGMRNGSRCNLKIEEPTAGQQRMREAFDPVAENELTGHD